ncbi:MAG: TIR domain-containing protein [Holophagales bacterium]|nr:TIR domain-containing protein [Holophagales bacterium]MYF94100.1 TIR domain-containing protein [Holophagales bacterium]
MARVFISYSHVDETFRIELEKHLSALRRQGVISLWHDRRIGPGEELHQQISKDLEAANIILLLVSADFLSSDYCYDTEMGRAMERHEQGDARVIPVILRPCDWQDAPFGKLLAVPEDGKPVSKHASLDDGLLEVAQAVRQAAASILGPAPSSSTEASAQSPTAATREKPAVTSPRSSNLRIPREFTDRDRDVFLTRGFEYISRYFENSLDELSARNAHAETAFRQVDANRFEATAYLAGREESRCGIWINLGGSWGMKGIFLSYAGLGDGNSYNESMSVVDDGFALHLEPHGLPHIGFGERSALTYEGAAEYYWSLFIDQFSRGRG